MKPPQHRWQYGHVRGCPLSPIDWVRTLLMHIRVRMWGGISADALVDRARAGDFIGMSGRGVFAWGQEITSNSRISHVGVVCVSRGVKCIAHATPHADGLPNHNPGAGAVRVTPLRDFIETYLDSAGLDLCLRRLHGVDDRARDADGLTHRDRVNAAVLATAAERAHLPFTAAPNTFLTVRYPVFGALLAAAVAAAVALGVGAPRRLVETAHRSIYCSEFVTLAYMAAGVFRADACDTQFRYAPGDFTAAATPVRSALDLGPGEGHLPFADMRYHFGAEEWIN